MKLRLIPLLMALILVVSPLVHAHPVPDLTKNGTITFTLRFQGEPIDGGTMELYRVGDIVEADGNYAFALVPELAGSGLNLENPDDPALAKELARLMPDSGLTPRSARVEDGIAAFRDVEPGLYLVTQPEAADGFDELDPFLISMPRYEDGTYITDVTAKPKVPLETEPTEPTDPTEPTTPGPVEPELPQTGQLNWPVPLMAVMGLFLFVLGWILCFRSGRDTGISS